MSRAKNGYNRAKVQRLWNICKHCHWCGKETAIQQSGCGRSENATATFDHLYHKSEKLRWTKKGRKAGVLACFECNQKRGRESYVKTLPLLNRVFIRVGLHTIIYKIKKTLYKL